MKLFQTLFIGGVFITRLHALDSAELAAVAKRFDNPSGEQQYQARMELNRLVAQATLPGKGDPAAVTKLLVAALQAADTSQEAAKYLLRALSRIATADAVAPLAKILQGPNPLLREEAREVLSWIHDPQAVAVLEASLPNAADKREKLGLIEALAAQKSPSSVPLLLPMMANPDPDLARASIAALAQIGGAPAVAALNRANTSGKLPPALKSDAQRALLAASKGDAETTLAVYRTAGSDSVKLAAFIALMEHAPAAAKPALIEAALKSEDPGLRQVALAAGMEISLPSLQAALAGLAGPLDAMPKDDRLVVLANLHHLKPAATAEKIALGRLASADEDERISAITALGGFPTPTAFQAVLQAVGAREPRVNQAAASALAGMSYPAAETTLVAMLKGDSSPDKLLAIKAVVFRQLPDASAILLEIIKGADPAASKEAMKSLYLIASFDELRSLCAATAAVPDAELRRSLVSISTRIATRINTDEARELVKDLK